VIAVPTEREGTAAHEAGHAVMRWLRGLPPTPISLVDDGDGCCRGTGQLYPAKDVLFVTLAGYAAESGFGVADVDLAGLCDDFNYARTILRSARELTRGDETAGEALERYFARTCELLRPHAEVIETLQRMLIADGIVSADAVAATCARPPPSRRPCR